MRQVVGVVSVQAPLSDPPTPPPGTCTTCTTCTSPRTPSAHRVLGVAPGQPYLWRDMSSADLVVPTATAPFRATITPPGSKSLTNRALVMAAMSDAECRLRNDR